MSTSFNPPQGLIIIQARLWGPTGDTDVRLALDTGASSSLIRPAILISAGYDPATAPHRVQMTTASGIEYVPLVFVSRFAALGQERMQFPVLAHTLPPTATIDGLIGLDFLRGQRLTIDFRIGQIRLR